MLLVLVGRLPTSLLDKTLFLTRADLNKVSLCEEYGMNFGLDDGYRSFGREIMPILAWPTWPWKLSSSGVNQNGREPTTSMVWIRHSGGELGN